MVWADREVNVGPLGIAHVQYWKDAKVHKIIAHKLALDWLRINNKLDTKIIERLSRGYEEGKGIFYLSETWVDGKFMEHDPQNAPVASPHVSVPFPSLCPLRPGNRGCGPRRPLMLTTS